MGKYSDKLNERVRVKGRLHGFCQICGFERKLSRDHVPPKKCNNLTDHDLSVLPLPSQYKIKSQPSQGGTHFKTICEECNNGTLGTEYDPELIKLTNEITSTVSAIGQRIIPIRRVIYLNIKPQRIARSIIGGEFV
jgi:5-methylcytosine-specific restriction endonuclease McrA